jgi:thermitase
MLRNMVMAILAIVVAQNVGATEYIVKHKVGFVTPMLNMIQGLSVEDIHEKGRLIKVDLVKNQEAQLLADLMTRSDIEYVIPNYKFKAFKNRVSINKLKEQWAITKVNAEAAWDKSKNKGSKKIIVAVIDTGVDYRHESLKQNAVPGYDFKDKDNDPMDKTGMQNPGHGTHCAGMVGATGLVDGGIVGLSPTVSLMPLRFLDEKGSGDLMDGVRAIDYAIEKGAHVISASWGAAVSKTQAQPIIEAVKRADDAGVIFVAAAANDGKNNDKVSMYPANAGFANTITVAASNSNDGKPSWSNYGRKRVHVSAPGENIMSTIPGNKYKNLSGTSMATPLVAGLVALLKSEDISLTGAQARAILQKSGAKVAIEVACHCRVDAAAAMDVVTEKQMIVVPSAATVAPSKTMNFSALNSQGTVNYTSSNPEIASINEAGLLTAHKDGSVKISATDASGKTAETLDIFIAKLTDSPDNGGGGGGGQCPLPPEMCEEICKIQPQLPFCQ